MASLGTRTSQPPICLKSLRFLMPSCREYHPVSVLELRELRPDSWFFSSITPSNKGLTKRVFKLAPTGSAFSENTFWNTRWRYRTSNNSISQNQTWALQKHVWIAAETPSLILQASWVGGGAQDALRSPPQGHCGAKLRNSKLLLSVVISTLAIKSCSGEERTPHTRRCVVDKPSRTGSTHSKNGWAS